MCHQLCTKHCIGIKNIWFYDIFTILYVGPRPDWDPDIVATLDDDYEHCNCLDDDFVDVANGPPSDSSHDDTLDLQNK